MWGKTTSSACMAVYVHDHVSIPPSPRSMIISNHWQDALTLHVFTDSSDSCNCRKPGVSRITGITQEAPTDAFVPFTELCLPGIQLATVSRIRV